MGLKLDIKTGILTIDEKYKIKPLMTLEQIRNSNLVKLMDERSKNRLANNDGGTLIIRTKFREDLVIINMFCCKKLTIVSITVDPLGSSEAYYTDNTDKLWNVVGKISQLMSYLLKDACGKRHFEWGGLMQDGGGRDYNVSIEISYIDPDFDYKF